MNKFIEKDQFAKHLGVEIIEHSKGFARAQMDIRDHHLNSAGTVHGGVLFGLADAVCSVAANSHGPTAVAIEVNISYFKAVSNGKLFARAEEISLNPTLATYLIKIEDTTRNPVALYHGTVYRKKGKKE